MRTQLRKWYAVILRAGTMVCELLNDQTEGKYALESNDFSSIHNLISHVYVLHIITIPSIDDTLYVNLV